MIALLLLATGTHVLTAQTSVRVGGGATMLAGNSEWDAGTGWLAIADVLATVGSPHVLVGFEGFYGATSGGPWIANEWTTGTELAHYGAFWVARVRTARPHRVSPYLQAGVGLVWGRLTLDYAPGSPYGDTTTTWTDLFLGFQAAAGLDVPLGRVAFWAEARYVGVSSDGITSPQYFAALAGLRMPLGRR
jgi:hypothetical protein